jgi:hypothetical protein
MQRCSSCGTRLEPEWDVCWLCHAPVPVAASEMSASVEDAGPTAADHVWTGPLARTGIHSSNNPLAAGLPFRMGMGHRARAVLTVVILVLAVASTGLFLPYVTYALIYGVFIAALSGYVVMKLWRGHT